MDGVLAGIYSRELSSEYLNREDGNKECNQKHEDYEIKQTGDIAQYNHLKAKLVEVLHRQLDTRAYYEVARQRDGEDDTVDPNDLEEGQPCIRLL